MSSNVRGLQEFNINLNRVKLKAINAIERELAISAIDFAQKGSAAAPILSSDLRKDILVPKIIPKGWKVGSSLPYALIQHENLYFNHPRGGGAKYLENPFNQNKDRYIRNIKDAVKNAIK